MSSDCNFEEVALRLRHGKLAVCGNCAGQGYTDAGTSACGECYGAGVMTPEMARMFKPVAAPQAPTTAAGIERRLSALITAVAVCVNDDHLTDLATLKRTWFYAGTGRDEPVGSRTWEQLRVLVREHGAPPAFAQPV